MDGIKTDVIQHVGQSLKEMDEAVQARLNHIERKAGQGRSRISVLERHAQMADERPQRLKKELAVVHTK